MNEWIRPSVLEQSVIQPVILPFPDQVLLFSGIRSLKLYRYLFVLFGTFFSTAKNVVNALLVGHLSNHPAFYLHKFNLADWERRGGRRSGSDSIFSSTGGGGSNERAIRSRKEIFLLVPRRWIRGRKRNCQYIGSNIDLEVDERTDRQTDRQTDALGRLRGGIMCAARLSRKKNIWLVQKGTWDPLQPLYF